MKELKTTKVVEEIIGYEAFDGEVFKSKEECMKYEGTANAVIKRNFMENVVVRKLEVCEVTKYGVAFLFADGGEDWFAALVRIKNETDLQYAQMFQENVHPGLNRKFTPDDIGKDLIISLGFENDCCYVYGTIDECIENFKKAISKFYEPEKPEGAEGNNIDPKSVK